jgi:hypothetical protein
MHKARAFFFVCLGILCIVAAYHLGARNAGAQAGDCITAGEVIVSNGAANVGAVAVGPGRIVYGRGPADPLPGSAAVVAIGMDNNGGVGVLLGDGSLYRLHPGSYAWEYVGPVCDGPCPCQVTPAQSISIGQLKAKYATPAGK